MGACSQHPKSKGIQNRRSNVNRDVHKLTAIPKVYVGVDRDSYGGG